MAHWSLSVEAAAELEQEYAQLLQQYKENYPDKRTPEAYAYRRSVIDVMASELQRARAHWRNIGESLVALAPDHEGARTFVKTQDNVATPEAADAEGGAN